MRYKSYKLMTIEELKRYIEYLYKEEDYKIDKIANELGCSVATASRICKKLEIDLNKNTTRIPFEKYGFNSIDHMVTTIKECLNLNMTKKEIANNMGCSTKTILRICKSFNL